MLEVHDYVDAMALPKLVRVHTSLPLGARKGLQDRIATVGKDGVGVGFHDTQLPEAGC